MTDPTDTTDDTGLDLSNDPDDGDTTPTGLEITDVDADTDDSSPAVGFNDEYGERITVTIGGVEVYHADESPHVRNKGVHDYVLTCGRLRSNDVPGVFVDLEDIKQIRDDYDNGGAGVGPFRVEDGYLSTPRIRECDSRGIAVAHCTFEELVELLEDQ